MSQKLIESGAATWQEPASYHYSSIGWPSDGSVSSGCVTQMSVLFRMQRGRSTTVDWCVWRLTKLIDISVQESLHWWCSTSSCCARAKRRKRHPSGDDLEAQNRQKRQDTVLTSSSAQVLTGRTVLQGRSLFERPPSLIHARAQVPDVAGQIYFQYFSVTIPQEVPSTRYLKETHNTKLT